MCEKPTQRQLLLSGPRHPVSMEGVETPSKTWKSNKAGNMLRVQDVCIVQYMVIQPYSTSTVHYRCCTGWADVMVSIMVEELAAIQTGEDGQQLRCVVRE